MLLEEVVGIDEKLVDSLDVFVMVDLVSALSDRYLSRLVSVKDDDWTMTTVSIKRVIEMCYSSRMEIRVRGGKVQRLKRLWNQWILISKIARLSI